MVVASGWSNPPRAKDPSSASPFPPAPVSRRTELAQTDVSTAPVILLVEDNPTDVFVIRELLNNSGINLRLLVSGNGEEALRYLQSVGSNDAASFPSLILLDLNLPRVAGLEVLKELRTSGRRPPIPVIVITSSTAESDRLAAQHLGAEGFFQKPSDLTTYMDLVVLVRNVLSPKRD